MTTFVDGNDVHPREFVTVKLYVPVASPDIVVVVPLPDTEPGLIVHVPEEGNPLRATLPVETEHVGWVGTPGTGALGVGGWTLITTPVDAGEVQPSEFVTVKLYVPSASPDTVTEVPVPVTDPGFIVQVPVEGRPFNITLPVARSHVGWVSVPGTGADGVGGCSGITTLAESADTHPPSFVTV